MTCAEAVRTHLLTLAPLTALVNARVWTHRFPQSPTKPAVLVQQISDVQDPHLRGTNGLKMARIQTDVIADTIASARAVDQAVQGTYSSGSPTGLRGVAVTVGSIEIRAAYADGYRELYDGEELKQARVLRDYRVWYED